MKVTNASHQREGVGESGITGCSEVVLAYSILLWPAYNKEGDHMDG
jgi:hypothetical protein